MDLIKFSNGKFGIRRRQFGVRIYADFENSGMWWPMDSKYFNSCCMRDEAFVRTKWVGEAAVVDSTSWWWKLWNR